MDTSALNPLHYRQGRRFESIEVIEAWRLCFHTGNTLKYIARNGRKEGEDPRQGLSKALWYLQRAIARPGASVRPATVSPSPAEVIADWGLSPNLAAAVEPLPLAVQLAGPQRFALLKGAADSLRAEIEAMGVDDVPELNLGNLVQVGR